MHDVEPGGVQRRVRRTEPDRAEEQQRRGDDEHWGEQRCQERCHGEQERGTGDQWRGADAVVGEEMVAEAAGGEYTGDRPGAQRDGQAGGGGLG